MHVYKHLLMIRRCFYKRLIHIVNGEGSGVSSGTDKTTGGDGDGWARQFLLSYQNGTAIVGKQNTNDQKGKYIGVDTITDIKQLGDDDLDLDALKALVENKKDAKTHIQMIAIKLMKLFIMKQQKF